MEKEVKENRIQELLVKREEYLNSGEIEKEIDVLGKQFLKIDKWFPSSVKLLLNKLLEMVT